MKFKSFLLFLFIFSGLVFSDVSFRGAVPLYETAADNPTGIVAADLDNDGDNDILFSSESNGKIAWYSNFGGGGTFVPGGTITTNALGAACVAAADLDNDGDLDVLAGSRTDNKVAWYENLNGRGSFGPEHFIYSGNAISIVAADLDGDGHQDILSAFHYGSGNKILWFKNDGQRNFAMQPALENTGSAYSVYAGDADNDGDMDVLATFSSGMLCLYENADGNARSFQRHIVASEAGGRAAIMADINRDDKTELVCCSEGSLAWLEQMSDKSYQVTQVIYQPVTGFISSIHVNDVDGDLDPDIIAAIWGEHRFVWFENRDGKGDFGEVKQIAVGTGANSLCTADFNGDADIDVAMSSYYADEITWCENSNGQGEFGETKKVTPKAGTLGYVGAGDIDSDGDSDILVWFDYSLFLFNNLNGKGLLSPPTEIENFAFHAGGIRIWTRDLNNDGDVDIVAGGQLLENVDGHGTFKRKDSYIGYNPFPADLDGDGDLDFVSPRSSSWLENKGNHAFSPSNKIYPFSPTDWEKACAADLDGDGDMDVIGAFYQNSSTNKFMWCENLDGFGSFGNEHLLHTCRGGWGVDVSAGDVDNDGDMDIIAYGVDEKYIAWFENRNGKADFSPPKRVSDRNDDPNLTSLDVIDIDSDGDVDILKTDYGADFQLYENIDGRGTFQRRRRITDSGYNNPFCLVCTDLNNDGRMDIVTGALSAPELAWYENLGTVDVEQKNIASISGHFLYQNYPNPFNPKTTISYEISSPGFVTMSIYNLRGQKCETLVDEFQHPGFHSVIWTPVDTPSGLYFCRLRIEDYCETIKLLLQK